MISAKSLINALQSETYGNAHARLYALDTFKSDMETLPGQGKCHVLHIRPQGGCVVAE